MENCERAIRWLKQAAERGNQRDIDTVRNLIEVSRLATIIKLSWQ